MSYVVTQSCCGDASCVVACPVNCIHPAPGEPGFLESEMVYIDANSCVDCGACTTACPVGAIKPHTKLTEGELPFIALADAYYQEFPHADRTPLALVHPKPRLQGERPLSVAIVGAGPSAMYAADELLKNPGVRVDVIDRLPTPYGLVRAGVAPDHLRTKEISHLFHQIEQQLGFEYLLDLEVGKDVTINDLRAHYDAVIYATGATDDRRLGIEGEDMVGSEPATSVVGWYNGHPDHADAYVDLSHERVVIVGNGNVALDVARILSTSPDELASTEISPLALAALRGSAVREIVVLGRRGPAEAAFTVPELVGLASHSDVDIVVDNGGQPIVGDTPKLELLRTIAARPRRGAGRRIVLRFHTAPVRILGDGVVGAVEVAATAYGADGVVTTVDPEVIETGMVLRAVGSRVVEVPGLPFDQTTATVPHENGRVEAGIYVTGWLKRGPSGFIGTNKSCAEETVASLIADANAGLLPTPIAGREEFVRLVGRIRLGGGATADRSRRSG